VTDAVATYRLQLHRGFDLDAAAAVVPYLAALGISHVYLSPITTARPGSLHGYDVVDPTRVNPELGGEPALERLRAALNAHGMGLLLDIVPNHMCVSDAGNEWWRDVLRRGRESDYADYFDIDWDAPGLDGKVLLPVLGDTLEAVIASGELTLGRAADGEPQLAYYEATFPLREAPSPGAAVADVAAAQHYRLDFWRTGLRRLNYRRFFDISELAGLRQERDEVFEATHQLALRLVRSGVADGLRVDHVDGLADPAGYLARLREEAGPATWIVVEKILAPGESLPGWPVEGTTGYDFAALATGVFVDEAGAGALAELEAEFGGDGGGFEDIAARAKRDVLAGLFQAEAARAERAAARAGVTGMAGALPELFGRFPRYRAYPGEDGDAAYTEFLTRLEQLSSAVAAKGVEDTAFYRALRLLALNEVGASPARFGTSVADFHAAMRHAAAQHPRALLATATHDTKRGEDARVRIALLSQAPERWRAAVRRWDGLAQARLGDGATDPHTRYLLWQTLVGAHPVTDDRLVDYMRKAVREAKVRTSWLDPDPEYEAAVARFARAVLADAELVGAVDAFVVEMAAAARDAALGQLLLKLTCPGVPDIYQGTELWDLSLVDPDNRRPVDFDLRRRVLAGSAEDAPGAEKLCLLRRLLALRRERPWAFAPGAGYLPLVAGRAQARVVAFARGAAADPLEIVVVVPRFPARDRRAEELRVGAGAGRWRDVVHGGDVAGPTLRLGSRPAVLVRVA